LNNDPIGAGRIENRGEKLSGVWFYALIAIYLCPC